MENIEVTFKKDINDENTLIFVSKDGELEFVYNINDYGMKLIHLPTSMMWKDVGNINSAFKRATFSKQAGEYLSIDEKKIKYFLNYIATKYESEFKKTEQTYKNIVQNDMELEEDVQDDRIRLQLPKLGKSISEFAEEIGDYFADKNVLFYRPIENCVVKLEMIPVNKEENKKILGFKQVKPSNFVTFLERYFELGMDFYIEETKEMRFKPKSLGKDIADITLESEQLKEKLPIIETIFSVPIPLLKDGVLVFPQNGYDKKLWSWLPYTAPKIREDMSLEEAKNILESIFKEFCFKDEKQDRINAIAGLLTPFCRKLYKKETSRTPIIFYKSNRPGAGKDYCAGITGLVYEGVIIDETPLCNDSGTHDDEFRKKVLSTFRIGKNRIHINNNRGFLKSAELEYLATSENFSDRVLGSSTKLEFPNTLEISMSANAEIQYTVEFSRRCIFVNLFLAVENPNERKFEKPNLHDWVLENRENILTALYTLVKNWFEMGMPGGTTPYASYPEWARVVGGIMESAGYATPCVNNDSTLELGGDKKTQDIKKFFELAYAKWGDIWVDKTTLYTALNTHDSEFSELFSWIEWDNEKKAKIEFGSLLRSKVNCIISGILLQEEDDKNSTSRKYKWTKEGVL